MTRRAFPAGLPAPAWWHVDPSGEPVDVTFDGAPYATPEAIAAFPPPPLDGARCDECGAVTALPSWEAARAAGWWSGTGPGPEGWATLCPPCRDEYEHNDREPEPR